MSFMNERPSHFRLLIRHQLGRRRHLFSASTWILGKAEEESSGENKPVSTSCGAVFACSGARTLSGKL